MLDIKRIRENLEEIKAAMQVRGEKELTSESCLGRIR